MDAGFILPQEKQQVLDEINRWLNTVYPYKKPPAHLCDPIDRASKFFRIDVHRKNSVFILDLEKHGHHLRINLLSLLKSVLKKNVLVMAQRC